MRTIAISIAAMAAGVALAGDYDQPYSLVESGDASELRKEAPAAVGKIDGKSTRNARKSDPIAPGKHVINVSFSSGRGVFSPSSQDVSVDMEPCVRYRVVAVYEVKTGPDWTPKLYPEPIGECRRKFGVGK